MTSAAPDSSQSSLPSSAADIVWPPHMLPYNDVDMSRDTNALNSFPDSTHFVTSQIRESTDAYDTDSPSNSNRYSMVSLRRMGLEEYHSVSTVGNSNDSRQYFHHSDDSDEKVSQNMVMHSNSPHQDSSSGSPPMGDQVLVVDPHHGKLTALDLATLQQHVSSSSEMPHSVPLQSVVNLSLSNILDRNSLSAYLPSSHSDLGLALDSSMLQRLPLSSQNLPRSLFVVDQNTLLNDPNLNHATLLSGSLMTQRDSLSLLPPSTSVEATTSSHISSSFPIHHKQLLVQKYTAELEVPSTSGVIQNHLVDGLSGQLAGNALVLDSHSLSAYNPGASSSGGQGLPLEIYGLDTRNLSLVTSSRDEDIVERMNQFSSSQSSSHAYITETHNPQNVMSPTVDSTVGTKLQLETNIDSSDSYGNQVDTTGYSHLEELRSHDESSDNSSVIRGVGPLDSSEVYATALDLLSGREQVLQSSVSVIRQPFLTDNSGSSNGLEELPPSSSQSYHTLENHYLRSEAHHFKSPCEHCNEIHKGECPNMAMKLIMDKPVPTRAWASLPASYLNLVELELDDKGTKTYGVFAKKTIPKRTQFGPVEGQRVPQKHFPQPNEFCLLVNQEDEEYMRLETSDDTLSNWMRFVRPANSYMEINLVVVQQAEFLYFNTTKAINPKTELRVWYSEAYAQKWGLPLLEPTEEERKFINEEENSWPCFECDQRFASSEELQKHLNDHEKAQGESEESYKHRKRKVRRCFNKSKDFRDNHQSDRGAASKIIKKARGKQPKKSLPSKEDQHICTLCEKVFPRTYSLHRHMLMHSGEKKYKCPICNANFSQVYNRNRHIRRHKVTTNKSDEEGQPKKEQWACHQCELMFETANLLNLHGLIHSTEDNLVKIEDKEEVKCMKCSKVFPSTRKLSEHISVHGTVRPSQSSTGSSNHASSPSKPFKCIFCYKGFANDERLIKHYLVHGTDETKPLSCDLCGKRFLNNSALACHVKVHSSEKKNFRCPFCNDEFDQISSLKEHIKIHCIDGVYTCPYCLKKFEEYNLARKHIRSFHSSKTYPCDQCEKVFPRMDKLKLHMLRHSSHREFLCASCGKQFKRKDKLKEHMRRMHHPDREAQAQILESLRAKNKKFIPKVSPTDYHRFIYKCHICLLGFKRRGMLVNHLAKRHPDIRPDSVPELNLPILKTTRDYYCQYCSKVYKSSSKRKAHIMKNHPGAELPSTHRDAEESMDVPGPVNPTYSQTVGSITTHPHSCDWCHKQYASKAKLLQHQRRKHPELVDESQVKPFIKKTPTRSSHTTKTSLSSSTSKSLITQAPAPPMSALAELFLNPKGNNSTIPAGSAIVIDTAKQKIYVEGTTQLSDSQASNDLLTQAVTELTQALSEYKSPTGQYLITRVISADTSNVLPLSDSPPSSPSQGTSIPLLDIPNSSIVIPSLDQIQINQLLAQYPFVSSLSNLTTTTSTFTSSWNDSATLNYTSNAS